MTQLSHNVIAFVLKGYPRLSETFIVNEILLLEELGFNIHIFALRNPGEKKIHASVQRIRARVTYIPDHFWKSFFPILAANLRLFLKSPRLYWPVFRYALFRSLRRRSSSTIKRFSQAAFFVHNCLPGSNIAHLHAHFSHGPTTVAYFASKLTGLRYSFSAHAKDIYLQDHEMLRLKLANAAFAVTCTEFNRRFLSGFCENPSRVKRVYHGIDLEVFRPQPEIAEKNGRPVILSVGRFVPKKGFPTLIQALHRLKQQGVPFRAYLVGGGPAKGQFRNLVQHLRLEDEIQILPQMKQEEVLQLYKQANVFALACEVQEDGDRDGIPNVLVEAMALGVPVVSTNVSGIPELIENGGTGLLVPEKNPGAMAAAIERLLRQPEFASRLALAARAKIEREFNARANVEGIGALLRQVVAGASEHATTRQEESDAKQPVKRYDSELYHDTQEIAATLFD